MAIKNIAGFISGAKAVRKSSKKKKTSAKSVSIGDDLNDWTNANQDVMRANSDYSYALSQDYLDAEQRYLSMASSSQKQSNDFNAEQAKIARDWSESMSATAHQREVADLKAAGLNPVISAYGSGASVGSAAAASSSDHLTSAFGNMAAQALGAVTSLANTMETNATSYANAGLNYEANIRSQDVQKYCAELASKTSLSMNQASIEMQKYIAEINNLNSKDIAMIAANASMSVAEINQATSMYSADIAYESAIKTAKMNNKTNIKMNEESTSATFQGFVTKQAKKAINYISDYLSGSGAYAVDAYNKSFG